MRNWIFAILVFALTVNVLAAQDQVLFKDGKVVVVFNRSADTFNGPAGANSPQEIIQIKGLKYEKLKAFVLENPYRVILDIFGASQKLHAKLPVQNALTVGTLRLAFHPDHVRLVVDFLPNQTPKYTVEEAAGLITLRLKSEAIPLPSIAATAVSEISTVTPTNKTEANTTIAIVPEAVTPTVVPTVEEHPTPSVSASIAIPVETVRAPVPTVPPTMAVPTIPTVATIPTVHKAPERAWHNPNAHQIVSTIEFAGAPGQQPLIRFVLSDKPEFNLIKRNETLYHLIIPGGSLSTAVLALPQFPPHDFQAFDMVAPLQKGTNTEISIVVDRGIKLGAFPKGNEILVRPLNR